MFHSQLSFSYSTVHTLLLYPDGRLVTARCRGPTAAKQAKILLFPSGHMTEKMSYFCWNPVFGFPEQRPDKSTLVSSVGGLLCMTSGHFLAATSTLGKIGSRLKCSPLVHKINFSLWKAELFLFPSLKRFLATITGKDHSWCLFLLKRNLK